MPNLEFYRSGDWEFRRIGDTNSYIAFIINPSSGGIELTGGATDTKTLLIPFPHRWVRMHFFHTASDKVTVSNEETNISVLRKAGQNTPCPYFEEYVFNGEAETDPYKTERFGEGFEYEGSRYRLDIYTVAGGAGDFLFPIFYIQKLGD